jgi:outer membrane protein TolC
VSRRTAPLAVLLLLGGLARAEAPQAALTVPATFSQGGTASAPGLEAQAWWQTFGDATLDALIARATQGSLTVQQAQARILQARATLGSAKADQLPTVTATASVDRSQQSANKLGYAVSPTTLYQAGFDATWEIDLFGGRRKAAEAALDRYQASVEDLHDTLLTLEGDVAQARAQLATTTAGEPTLEASVKRSIHRLGILLGLEPTALLGELSEAKPLPSSQAAVSTGLPSELLARRPDLRSAERTLAAAMADVGVAKAELYPHFDLTFGLGLQSLQTSNLASVSSRYWSIIPGLSLPIFNRGALKATVSQKEAVYQEKLAAFRASYQSALEDVENALADYAAENGRRQALEESLRQNQEAFGLAQERYRRGLTSFLDVLTAQASLQAAQSSLSQSQANLLTDLVALSKALGGGWAAAPVAS